MKRILVPTDFTIQFLSLLKKVINSQTEKVNILLIYNAPVSGSITELLFFSKKQQIEKLQEEKFNEALEILSNKNASVINSISMDLYQGFTKNAFDSYIKAKRIDEAYIPMAVKKEKEKNFLLINTIRRANLTITEVETPLEVIYQAQGSFAKLLTS
ncbi:hypothetical protein JM658_06775 [Joostella atrarenae]|uniref:UspA domain-containing protein n=1 Tax=Joostella atrarenae TaxID=679257 RepID=A0ABS9J289_9FLAO|nr:hypothetical protein [Joostella atrarenae]MCF8714532.1 hypothetical protein [Joostella atrarenae]